MSDTFPPPGFGTSSSNSSSSSANQSFSLRDDAAANSCKADTVAAPVSTCPYMPSTLTVRVTDEKSKPLRGVAVVVPGVGDGTTDKDGKVDFGKVDPKTYNVQASKEGYRPSKDAKQAGPTQVSRTVPSGTSTVVELQLFAFRENIVFIGSEMDYHIFWTKMMFVAAAWYEVFHSPDFREADRYTIAFVDNDYNSYEKVIIDQFKRKSPNLVVTTVGSTAGIVSLINNRVMPQGKFLLQDVFIFSHGTASNIRLNYDGTPDFSFEGSDLSATATDAFVPDGKIVSYACRTGNSVSWTLGDFTQDSECHPELSLAQQMADHFHIEVQAFLTRTNYGKCLRDKADSLRISTMLKAARATGGTGYGYTAGARGHMASGLV